MQSEKNRSLDIMNKLTAIEYGHTGFPYVPAVCGAYVLYIAQQHPGLTGLKEILEAAQVPKHLQSYILFRIEDHWNEYTPLLTVYHEDELADFFANSPWLDQIGAKGGLCSSLPIAELVYEVLGIKPEEKVCDLGCGMGDFLHFAYFRTGDFEARLEKNFVGYEFSADFASIADMRMSVDDTDVEVIWDDCFRQAYTKDKFDKVFCHAPFGMRGLAGNPEVQKFIRGALPDFPELMSMGSSDWLFAARAFVAIKKGGKAVVVMPPSAMVSKGTEHQRRYFLQRNLIEAVIELPERLYNCTGISSYMVVLSEGNERVKMVRAGNICERGRRNNTITSDNVAEIIRSLLDADSANNSKGLKNVVVISKDKIIADECNLTVHKYFTESVTIRNGVPFGKLVNFAKRGAAIASKELDELVCEDGNGIHYITSGSISDGVIDANLPSLSRIPDSYQDFCVKEGDLVITRVMAKGADFKVAVVELSEGETILPNGNLLVITLDTQKVDPYYIKAYLETEYAQMYLQSVAVGNVVKTLQYKNLEQLSVPLLPLARQHEIGDQCRTATRRVQEAMRNLVASRKSLANVFADNAGDCFVDTKKEAL